MYAISNSIHVIIITIKFGIFLNYHYIKSGIK